MLIVNEAMVLATARVGVLMMLPCQTQIRGFVR